MTFRCAVKCNVFDKTGQLAGKCSIKCLIFALLRDQHRVKDMMSDTQHCLHLKDEPLESNNSNSKQRNLALMTCRPVLSPDQIVERVKGIALPEGD